MKRHVQVLLLVLTGLGLLHTALFSDLCLRYVKEGLRPVLIASGVLLLLLGLAGAALDHMDPEGDDQGRNHDHDHDHAHDHDHDHDHAHDHDHDHDHDHAHDQDRHEDDHGHDHSTAPRIAWLLFLPALSLLFYAPPALGAYTASHANNKAVKQEQRFDPLPATTPLPLTLTDFTARVQQDREQAIRGRSISMTGFVTPAGPDGGWYLTRIIFTCCAADSQSVKVRMYGTPAPPANTWLAVTGNWHPRGTLGTKSATAALDIHRTERISPPVNAFTDDLPLTPS
ncbi:MULTISPECIES: TIGR03943 family protein [unclassified Streptomyces]|uniref:TIGR03943 family putative permease subunit n=1 Tax=unclassified Streptomyces TaxID=2593676 RepID=UPI00225A6C71|nr:MULTISPECIES: TIGR03943 family protein [unclassified Streptomyces]MCX5059323.1 TIGR03943 family protein [Streptomyces sp. NBC_00452]MCX5290236.1 TIGR03943 family protein [Streptomyces sp. NBC_00183]